MSHSRGFTLIEVLAALAIVAIGMSAVLSTLGDSASTAGYLRDKTLAQWVALNQIATTRLSGEQPLEGTTDGKVDFAGRHWRWRQQVTSAGFQGVVRIEVTVQEADTPAGDAAPWMGSAMTAMGDAVALPKMQSLYDEYAQSPTGANGTGTGSQPASPVPFGAAAPASDSNDGSLSFGNP